MCIGTAARTAHSARALGGAAAQRVLSGRMEALQAEIERKRKAKAEAAASLTATGSSAGGGARKWVKKGDVEKVLNGPGSRMDGRCVMQLKLGPRALSQQHDRQRFRIKIAPADPQLATAYPTLTQLTEPVKSVTKLVRDVSGREPFFSLFAAAVC